MAQATFSVRMDENLKKQFDSLCADFGMTASTAINVFARAVVREKRIPFEIKASEPPVSRESAMKALMELRSESARNFPDGMSVDEINEEIGRARMGGEE